MPEWIEETCDLDKREGYGGSCFRDAVRIAIKEAHAQGLQVTTRYKRNDDPEQGTKWRFCVGDQTYKTCMAFYKAFRDAVRCFLSS
jgi:hypothetical protein